MTKFLNASPNPRKCNKCDKTIYWAKTREGKPHAVDPDGQSHYYSGQCGSSEPMPQHDPGIHQYYQGERDNPHASSGSGAGVSGDDGLADKVSRIGETVDSLYHMVGRIADKLGIEWEPAPLSAGNSEDRRPASQGQATQETGGPPLI